MSDSDRDEKRDPVSDSESDDASPTFPLRINYCPNCSFPAEFCEFSGKLEGCKPWLETQKDVSLEGLSEKGKKAKKPKAEGDVELPGGKKKKAKEVLINLQKRGGRKYITSVKGMDQFGMSHFFLFSSYLFIGLDWIGLYWIGWATHVHATINNNNNNNHTHTGHKLDELAKAFKKSFSCGCAVVSNPGQPDAIEIQVRAFFSLDEFIVPILLFVENQAKKNTKKNKQTNKQKHRETCKTLCWNASRPSSRFRRSLSSRWKTSKRFRDTSQREATLPRPSPLCTPPPPPHPPRAHSPFPLQQSTETETREREQNKKEEFLSKI